MKNLSTLVLALLISFLVGSCTPEVLTVKVQGVIRVTPNPTPAFPEDYIEWDVDGYALYSDLPTRYFRETATQTNNPQGKRVDTVFVNEIFPRNFIRFTPK